MFRGLGDNAYWKLRTFYHHKFSLFADLQTSSPPVFVGNYIIDVPGFALVTGAASGT